MVEVKSIEVDGIATTYREAGEGEPIVLIHGGEFGGSSGSHSWPDNLYDGLAAAGHRVIGIDRLGQAGTGNPSDLSGYRVSTMLKHLYATLDALGVSNATVVGQSRGAFVAARAALDRPDLVKRLGLINSGTLAPGVNTEPLPGDPTYTIYVEQMNGDPRHDMALLSVTTDHITDEWIELLTRYRNDPKAAEARAALKEVNSAFFAEFEELKTEVLDWLSSGAYRKPTVIIWGVGDKTVSPTDGLNLFGIFSGHVDMLRMHMINRCGHAPFREYPDEVRLQLLDFISRTPSN